MFKRFTPTYVAKTIYEIEIEKFLKLNIKCVLCDLDNTLDAYYQKTPTIEAQNFAKKLKENGIELILSKPCFEIWLLLHFRYSTHGYQNNHEVLNELSNQWPEYRKNIESFQNLQNRCGMAVENALRLKQFHKETKGTDVVEKCNPSTDVHKMVTCIINIGSKF